MTDAMAAALNIVVRTSVLLICVSLLSFALRRASASVRHALWAVGLLAVLVFPVASRLLPEWNWVILPQRVSSPNGFDTTPPAAPQIEIAKFHVSSAATPTPIQSSADVPETPTRIRAATTAWNWAHWLALIWAAGSIVFFIGWAKSVWSLHRLTQSVSPSATDGLNLQLEQAQRDIGVSASVALRLAQEAIPPMTWGIFHHAILLPDAARKWSPVRQRLVLSHELAHIKRNDGLGQLLAQTVCCIYWFNPLVWYAVRQLHAERERACDDCVLRLGADNADYADHLLQITRGLNAGFIQSAVSMAHPSQLKTRLLAILDSRMRRSRASRVAATSLLTTVSVLMLTIAAIQLTSLSTMALPAFAAPPGALFWSPAPAPAVQPLAEETTQQPTPPAAAVSPQRDFINQYCLRCHNNTSYSGNLSFDTGWADIDRVAGQREVWEKVVRRLRAGMDPTPVAGVARPSDGTIRSMIQFLETELDRNAKTYVPPIGPHRLNRTEYTNAIRDVLDLEIDATKLLPEDDRFNWFDNMVSALSRSPKAIEPYVAIAPVVSRMAIQSATNAPSYQRIFTCPETSQYGQISAACAREMIRTLTDNAYRGFATTADVDNLLASFRASGYGYSRNSLVPVLTQILADPKFLYRTEEAPADIQPGEVYRISDLALASRLSFFLWSTIPDQELLDLAKQGKLHEPAVLEQQTLRMLKDSRAETLSTNFAGQWLGYRSALPRIAPSPAFFPDFNDALRQDMDREVELFFDSIVREDRNVADLLTADYTFVNNRLARLCGISGVSGSQFRRVALTGALDSRRGLVGKAALLSITNNYGTDRRTSPVGRGILIMNTMLGVEPPPPPPNAPPLADRSRDPKVVEPAMRKTMNDHKTSQSCIGCHRYIDPIGYSLENFNAIGAWRDIDGGAPINAADMLFDGTAIDGPAGLRQWLVGKSDVFVQTITEKLMTYALGRSIQPQDMPLIRAIDREAARQNNRFSAIVLSIVKSDTFQMNSK